MTWTLDPNDLALKTYIIIIIYLYVLAAKCSIYVNL